MTGPPINFELVTLRCVLIDKLEFVLLPLIHNHQEKQKR